MMALLLLSAQEESNVAKPIEQLRAADVQWDGYFGEVESDDKHLLVIMARGFMGFPGLGGPEFPEEMDEYITRWISAHPEANVIPVFDVPLGDEVAFRHVWLVDGAASLNVELVRAGMCTADAMRTDRDLFKLKVDQDLYDRFAANVAVAEEEAMNAKRRIWQRPDFDAVARKKRARVHIRADRCQAAADALAGPDHYELYDSWMRTAQCFHDQDKHEKAVAAFDKAIATTDRPQMWTVLGKAKSIARLHGLDAAVAMTDDHPDRFERYEILAGLYLSEEMRDEAAAVIERAITAIDESPAFQRRQLAIFLSLASVYSREEMYADAATILEKGVLRFIESNQIPFDADYRFRFEPLRVQTMGFYWDKLHELRSPFNWLSQYCLEMGDFDKTYKYATMGLSLKREIDRYNAMRPWLSDDYCPEAVDAGDLFLRLRRAKVFIHRKDFAAAKRDIDHAKLLLDLTISGGDVVGPMVTDAYEQLRQTFPEQTVTIPPRFVWEPPKQPRPPEIDYVGASDDQLIRLADEADPAKTYSAVQELLSRDANGQLSEKTMTRAIEGALRRQADSDRRWQAFDGVLLARAAKREMLTAEQLAAYVRHSVKFGDLRARPATKGPHREVEPGRFTIQVSTEVRAGEIPHPVKGNAEGFDIEPTVYVKNTTIDGRVATFLGRRHDSSNKFLVPPATGAVGYTIGVAEPLSRGAHRISITLDVEIRKATFFQHGRPYADDTAPVIANWIVEKAADFWAPGPPP